MADHSVAQRNSKGKPSQKSPENSMYAKILLKRNNTAGFSSWAFESRRRSLVLRPIPLSYEERIARRRQQISQLFLHGRISTGRLLRMSYVNPTEKMMLCDLCNQEAFITCTFCRIARYCCTDHRKKGWKFHRERCIGQRPTGPETCSNGTRVNGYNLMDLSRNGTSEQAAYVVEKLRKQGYCYIDKFHGEDTARDILKEVKDLHQRQKFTDGELVSSNGNGSTLNKKIRDDKITWVDGKEKNCETILHHMNAVNSLIRKCNDMIDEYDIDQRTKAMVACYPGQGTGYKRHVDNPSQDGRCITTLYYLNPGWTEEKGGILKLYPGGGEQAVSILPVLDRLLLFWSDRRNPHEVEPSHDVRYAITLWYFDKNERATFKKRQEALRNREVNINITERNGENANHDESQKDGNRTAE